MLPSVEIVYPGAKAVFWPWLRFGLRWTIEGVEHIPTDGPVILASNHVSYLDPLTLAYVADRRARRVRYMAKAELFAKRGLGPLLRAGGQIPVERGKESVSGALSAALGALSRGECVAVFPEGTISDDLEPMRAKSGTARLAQRSGAPVVPVGLWGTHRTMTKGRRPDVKWGVAQVAVVGAPCTVGPDDKVREATDRIMGEVAACVARARACYPQRPAPGADGWWWRDPETASTHQRPA